MSWSLDNMQDNRSDEPQLVPVEDDHVVPGSMVSEPESSITSVTEEYAEVERLEQKVSNNLADRQECYLISSR